MSKLSSKEIKEILEEKYVLYAKGSFIGTDPISIPKSYTLLQDIEIAAFITAIFSWGQRVTIINKSRELFGLMDNAPYDFILNHSDLDLKRFERFVHRTFNSTDALYFIAFLRHHYTSHESLESAFIPSVIGYSTDTLVRDRIIHFHNYFCSLPYFISRTRKHIATPERKSTCKRINMFLRWMVRSDKEGIDFNLWHTIKPKDLMIPYDVHVERVARHLGILQRKQKDWQAVEELTSYLRILDPQDPIKYDFALFGMGVMDKE